MIMFFLADFLTFIYGICKKPESKWLLITANAAHQPAGLNNYMG